MAEYTFPKVSDIIEDSSLLSDMDAAWQMMNNTASTFGRREYGFFIYYNRNTGRYYTGNVVSGPLMSGCLDSKASVILGRSTNNLECCAFFHCHTTLHFCSPNNTRLTGPSPSDRDFANSRRIPGILYDYADSEIEGGHDINKRHKIYTFGPRRRDKIIV